MNVLREPPLPIAGERASDDRRAGVNQPRTPFFTRLLMNPAFRRWAAAFPLTRPIARRRARALFDLCAGFVYAQVLAACVRLDLFAILAERPLTADELSDRLALPPDATNRLLAAAGSLRLVKRQGKRYGLGALGAAMVGETGVPALVRHHTLFYDDLRDPVALLRGERPDTALSRYWAFSDQPTPHANGADYTALMAASQPMIAAQVLEAYDLARHRCLLDLGGGDGSFLRAVAARAPTMKLMLFDLPHVVARAGPGIEAYGGDFRAGPLPAGADVISLIRILHDHDDATALAILRTARAALPAGGTLLLAEPMSAPDATEPIADAYFGFYLLAMGSGRPRSPAAIATMLKAAGFATPRLRPTTLPMLVRVMTALADLDSV